MPVTTAGQLLIEDSLPEAMRGRGNLLLDKKGLTALLQEVGKSHPEKYRQVSKALSDIGWRAAQETGGFSFGLQHLRKSKASVEIRNRIQARMNDLLNDDSMDDKKRDEAIIELAGSSLGEQQDKVLAESLAEKNPLAYQVRSGSRGNKMNLASLRGSDLMYVDHRDRPIPVPVLRSYSEGLTPAEYWSGSYGARKGVLSVKLAVRDSGYLGKLLNQVTHRLVVDDLDSADKYDGNLRGMPVDTSDPDSEGSLLAHDAGPYKRNTVLTPRILQHLSQLKHDRILVRSPTVGGPANGGVWSRDVGVREHGNLPGRGSWPGMAAAQALNEPLSQAGLNAKHTGGVAGEGKAVSGFDSIESMVQIPKHVAGGATHAETDGIVGKIFDAPAGGKYVHVNGEEHYVPDGLNVKVKTGDRVEAGDMISDGMPSPSKVVQHKGIGEGRRYFTQVFKDAMTAAGIKSHRRNIELLSRGLINHVRLTDEMGDFAPDDVISYNEIEHNYTPRPDARTMDISGASNRYLEKPALHYTIGTRVRPSVMKDLQHFGVKQVTVHDNPPPFEPEMIRGAASLSFDPDWTTKQYGSGLKGSLLKGVHRGATSDEKGTSFVPSIIRAVDFGRGTGPVRQPEPGWPVKTSAAATPAYVKLQLDGPDGRLQHHYLDADTWDDPAGRIEAGEDPTAAAVRELFERTGYRIDPLKLKARGVADGFHVFGGDASHATAEGQPQTAIRFHKQAAVPGVPGGPATDIGPEHIGEPPGKPLTKLPAPTTQPATTQPSLPATRPAAPAVRPPPAAPPPAAPAYQPKKWYTNPPPAQHSMQPFLTALRPFAPMMGPLAPLAALGSLDLNALLTLMGGPGAGGASASPTASPTPTETPAALPAPLAPAPAQPVAAPPVETPAASVATGPAIPAGAQRLDAGQRSLPSATEYTKWKPEHGRVLNSLMDADEPPPSPSTAATIGHIAASPLTTLPDPLTPGSEVSDAMMKAMTVNDTRLGVEGLGKFMRNGEQLKALSHGWPFLSPPASAPTTPQGLGTWANANLAAPAAETSAARGMFNRVGKWTGNMNVVTNVKPQVAALTVADTIKDLLKIKEHGLNAVSNEAMNQSQNRWEGDTSLLGSDSFNAADPTRASLFAGVTDADRNMSPITPAVSMFKNLAKIEQSDVAMQTQPKPSIDVNAPRNTGGGLLSWLPTHGSDDLPTATTDTPGTFNAYRGSEVTDQESEQLTQNMRRANPNAVHFAYQSRPNGVSLIHLPTGAKVNMAELDAASDPARGGNPVIKRRVLYDMEKEMPGWHAELTSSYKPPETVEERSMQTQHKTQVDMRSNELARHGAQSQDDRAATRQHLQEMADTLPDDTLKRFLADPKLQEDISKLSPDDPQMQSVFKNRIYSKYPKRVEELERVLAERQKADPSIPLMIDWLHQFKSEGPEGMIRPVTGYVPPVNTDINSGFYPPGSKEQQPWTPRDKAGTDWLAQFAMPVPA